MAVYTVLRRMKTDVLNRTENPVRPQSKIDERIMNRPIAVDSDPFDPGEQLPDTVTRIVFSGADLCQIFRN